MIVSLLTKSQLFVKHKKEISKYKQNVLHLRGSQKNYSLLNQKTVHLKQSQQAPDYLHF